MTRTTRKTIAFIVCVAFIAAIVCFFAVATKGFRYWDGATWFDYWGKGKPKATQQVDKPADKPENSDEPVSVSMAAANAGLTYDSEDAAATVEVKRYPAPTVQFGYEGDPCFLIQTSGYIIPQFQVRYIHFMGDYTISTQVYNYDHVNGDSGFVLGLNDLGDAGCTPGDCYSLEFTNLGSGDFLDSTPLKKGGYLPTEEEMNNMPYWQGTKVIVPIITGYEYTPAHSGVATVWKSHEIHVLSGQSGDPVVSRDLLNAEHPVSCSVYREFKDTVTGGLINSPFTLVDNEGTDNDYFEIDLTKLIFADSLHEVCTVYIQPIYKVKYQSLSVWAVYPYFHFSISRLNAPGNIRITGGQLVWDAVDGATGYAVFLDDTTTTVTDPVYELTDIAAGTYTVRVRALGNVGSQLAASETSLASLTPYNASNRITQLVALTLNVDGDNITKLVPHDSAVGEYLYDVKVKNKEFGGWYYDSGFSRKVLTTDKLESDTTIYARLSDKKVTDRPLSWWERNMWYVLGPCIALVVIGVAVGGVLYAKKKKSA